MPRDKGGSLEHSLIAESTAALTRGSTVEGSLVTDRFWNRVECAGPDDCWLWTGPTTWNGYGAYSIKVDGVRHWRAHRVAWALANGKIPKGQCILHDCDVRLCVNPAHLRLGSQRDNIEDQLAKDRWLCCEQAGRAKLSNEIVLAMRASTKPHTYFARKYGVHPTTIANARSGKKWAKLNNLLDSEDS